MILPVILSGGFGTRLWPLSHKERPKQFIHLLSKHSLFQETVKRVNKVHNCLPPLFTCNKDHRFIIAQQLQEMEVKISAIMLEPVGKNTAPAITLSALQALSIDEDPILLVSPSDHLIANQNAFLTAVDIAAKYASTGKLITFGIVPHRPETGYGYIQAGKQLDSGVQIVDNFVEKPDVETAQQYLKAGNYYWNSGIFMFRASRFLQEMEKYAPDILAVCRETFAAREITPDFIQLQSEIFAQCRSDSIDYAVMEKTNDAVVVSMDAGWSDVGSWASLYELEAKNDQGNVEIGNVITDGVKNSYLRSEGRTLAVVGVENLVVVETNDAVLVINKDQTQQVKTLLAQLQKRSTQ